jgi:peptide chain release factor 1
LLSQKESRIVFDPFSVSELTVEIQFGEGGKDSKLFVHDLAAAYLKYANSLGFKSEILESSDGHMLLEFCGEGVWSAFKNESGKHVVQRIPPTESKGRRQTSVISVAVLSIPDKINIVLKDEDLEIKTQGGHGCGGQHQNATDSAVRMIHKPTGLKVFINGRKQIQNRKKARKILTARVNDHYVDIQQSAYGSERQQQMSGGTRSGKIRTYNFLKSCVTDHRLNRKTRHIDGVMRGKFDLLF